MPSASLPTGAARTRAGWRIDQRARSEHLCPQSCAQPRQGGGQLPARKRCAEPDVVGVDDVALRRSRTSPAASPRAGKTTARDKLRDLRCDIEPGVRKPRTVTVQ